MKQATAKPVTLTFNLLISNKTGDQNLSCTIHLVSMMMICPVIYRVLTDIKTLFFRTFQDLQRPNSRVFQDSKNAFSRTFQDMLHSQTWLHEVKKCTYQISFRCNCITVNKPKCNTCGDKMHIMYYNEFLLQGLQAAILEPGCKIFRTTTLEFQNFSRVFQDLCLFPGLSRPGNLNILISRLSRVSTNPEFLFRVQPHTHICTEQKNALLTLTF